MISLSTEHLERCLLTLENALLRLHQSQVGSIEYEVYRNAAVKGFELTLETAGTLLRKKLKNYFSHSSAVDGLTYKDILRHAAHRGLLDLDEIERWFAYRDNRNSTAHDYGQAFAEETLMLLPKFVADTKKLIAKLKETNDQD